MTSSGNPLESFQFSCFCGKSSWTLPRMTGDPSSVCVICKCQYCGAMTTVRCYPDNRVHIVDDFPGPTSTPAGEEPAPDNQDSGACDACQSDAGSTPGSVPPLHSRQSPPGSESALTADLEAELSARAQRFREALAKCSTFSELDEAIRKHIPPPTKQGRLFPTVTDASPPESWGDVAANWAAEPYRAEISVCLPDELGLPTTDNPPPPIDEDLRDYAEEDWTTFVKESFEELLSRPVCFDIDTGAPGLVPREEIPLAKAAGYITVGQVLSGKSSPSESE